MTNYKLLLLLPNGIILSNSTKKDTFFGITKGDTVCVEVSEIFCQVFQGVTSCL